MAAKKKNRKNRSGSVLDALVMQKKKTIAAVALVLLMIFMWIRVLTGAGPQNASAGSTMPKQAEQQKKVEITYHKLPETAGRNDRITKDFFSPPDWESFEDNNNDVEVKSSGKNENDKWSEALADSLEVDAIVSTEVPQVFINGRLLKEKDRLAVTTKEGKRVCEIVTIEGNAVTLKCSDVTLKLMVSK
jgi:hypothetical protein